MTWIMLISILYLMYRMVTAKTDKYKFVIFLALGVFSCLIFASQFKEIILIILCAVVMLKYREG